VVERLEALAAAQGPLLIACDLDGTLAPIVRHASDARVPQKVLAVLDRLAAKARVAVITGRDLNTARRMIPVEGVMIVGSHGLESSFESDLLPSVDRLALAASLERVEEQVIAAVPGSYVHIERKAISTAFHFRSAPGLEASLRHALAVIPEGLRLREGRMVLEVLPNTDGGKDRAVEALARHFRVHSILAMGDDATDAAMFRATHLLGEGGKTVLTAGVSGGAETPRDIIELADVLLASPDEAREALETMAKALGA
jgi:trehalose 6-phosphate phosphatase